MSIGDDVRLLTHGEPHRHTTYNRPVEDLIAAIDENLVGVEKFATKNRSDLITDQLIEGKVTKEVGKGLSTNDYTNLDKAKLDGLVSSHWRGVFDDVDDLDTIDTPVAGDYADIDLGTGLGIHRYIYDSGDSIWVIGSGGGGGGDVDISPESVKQLYESNANTNVFTDGDKTKLSGMATGATKNASDADLRNRATHTGTQNVSSITGLGSAATMNLLNIGTTAASARAAIGIPNVVDGATKNATDAQLRNRATHTGTQPVATITGLGTSATKNVGTSDGDVLGVGAGGWLGSASTDSYMSGYPTSLSNNITQVYRRETTDGVIPAYATGFHFAAADTWGRLRVEYSEPNAWIQGGTTDGSVGWTAKLYHSENQLDIGKTPQSARAALGLDGGGAELTYSPWTSATTLSDDYDCTRIETNVTSIVVPSGLTRDIVFLEYRKSDGGREDLYFSSNVDVGSTDTTVREGEVTIFTLLRIGTTGYKLIRMGSGYVG